MAVGTEELPLPSDAVDPVSGVIREGKAEVLPNRQPDQKEGKADVFYNPAQVFNRDLSILVISTFAKLQQADAVDRRTKREQKAKETNKPVKPSPPPGILILEALAATGIRSIRYAKEIVGVRKIVANDCDETAVGHIRKNMSHNDVPGDLIEVTCEDASTHMYARRCRGIHGLGDFAYDVIDLDPYGTASPFLDAAVQAVADGGLICITSTDMPVLGGNHPETCFARYGGSAIKAGYVHEMALRLVMHATATAAAKYGREARPLVCVSIDFYVRLFVRIFDSAARAKFQASKVGQVHQCVQCETFFVQPFGDAPKEGGAKFKLPRVVAPGPDCPECTGRMKLGGPFYIGDLYDKEFVDECLQVCSSDKASELLPGVTSWKKIRGLLTAISEEHGDLVLHYRLPQLCKGLKLEPIPLRQFRGTLTALGYRVSYFHRDPEAIKTDAPNQVVYDLMRIWAEERPPKNTLLPQLLKKDISLKRPVEWVSEEEVARSAKVPKFLPNPEANWGPKARARGGAAPTPCAATDATSVDAEADLSPARAVDERCAIAAEVARGCATAILIVLSERGALHALLVRELDEGKPGCLQIPVGTFDSDGIFAGDCATHVNEALGFVKEKDIVDMTLHAFGDAHPGVYPRCSSSGKCSRVCLHRVKVSAELLAKLQGESSNRGFCRLQAIALDDLWRSSPDARTLGALCLYDKLMAAGTIPAF